MGKYSSQGIGFPLFILIAGIMTLVIGFIEGEDAPRMVIRQTPLSISQDLLDKPSLPVVLIARKAPMEAEALQDMFAYEEAKHFVSCKEAARRWHHGKEFC